MGCGVKFSEEGQPTIYFKKNGLVVGVKMHVCDSDSFADPIIYIGYTGYWLVESTTMIGPGNK